MCVTRLSDKIRERRVPLGESKKGFGRLVFVSGLLEHLRLLLGPLFARASAGPRFSCLRPSTMILLLMVLLAGKFNRAHTAGCRESPKELGELFRLDAKAEGDVVAVGGWLSRDGAAAGNALWFAGKLTRQTAPWAFTRGAGAAPLRRAAGAPRPGRVLPAGAGRPQEGHEAGRCANGHGLM